MQRYTSLDIRYHEFPAKAYKKSLQQKDPLVTHRYRAQSAPTDFADAADVR
jgi:hypothetical protein